VPISDKMALSKIVPYLSSTELEWISLVYC